MQVNKPTKFVFIFTKQSMIFKKFSSSIINKTKVNILYIKKNHKEKRMSVNGI